MFKDSNFQIFFSELKLPFRKPAAFLPSGCSFFENLSSFNKNPNMLQRVGFALDWLRTATPSSLLCLNCSESQFEVIKWDEGAPAVCRRSFLHRASPSPPICYAAAGCYSPSCQSTLQSALLPPGCWFTSHASLVVFTRGRSELN